MVDLASTTAFPNGLHSFFVDSNSIEKTANFTLILDTDSGKTFTTSVDGVIFTLPAIGTPSGNVFTFVNTAQDGEAGLRIDPDVGETIVYASGTLGDLINTKATSKYGDSVTLASLDGVAWQVTAVRGIWVEATP